MNLLALFNDAAAIVRLRYRPAEEYRYGAAVTAAVLLALGAIHSAAVAPLIGSGYGTVALSVLMISVRWLALSQCISAVLHYFGAPRLPLRGYILASEALALSTLLVMYIPDLAPLSLLSRTAGLSGRPVGNGHHLPALVRHLRRRRLDRYGTGFA